MNLKLVLLVLLGLGAGLWAAARLGLPLPWRTVAPEVPAPLVALHSHFAKLGLPTRVGLVRRDRTGMVAKGMFVPKDFDGAFSVILCDDAATAKRLAPQIGGTATRGAFILALGYRPEDGTQRKQIIAAFEQFDAEAAARP